MDDTMLAHEKAEAARAVGFVMGQLRTQIRTLHSEKYDLQRQVNNLEAEIGRLYAELIGRPLSIDEWSGLQALIHSQLPPKFWPPERIVTVPGDVVIGALFPESASQFMVDLFVCSDPIYRRVLRHKGVSFNLIAGAEVCPHKSSGNIVYTGTVNLATWTREELEWLASSLYLLGNRMGAVWLRRQISSGALRPLGQVCPPIDSGSSDPEPTR